MNESSQDQYIYELENALEKLLYFFEPSDTGAFTMLNFDESIPVDEDVSAALLFAERTLYGYTDTE